ncbi:hypothetical protein niasHT_019246 [Heterodera trifolii]|uniref:Uncharacterized protein n=1 Tax=Heterodera trifolii TaxID=157864 RepID=A0ABD2L2N6_9BILA
MVVCQRNSNYRNIPSSLTEFLLIVRRTIRMGWTMTASCCKSIRISESFNLLIKITHWKGGAFMTAFAELMAEQQGMDKKPELTMVVCQRNSNYRNIPTSLTEFLLIVRRTIQMAYTISNILKHMLKFDVTYWMENRVTTVQTSAPMVNAIKQAPLSFLNQNGFLS